MRNEHYAHDGAKSSKRPAVVSIIAIVVACSIPFRRITIGKEYSPLSILIRLVGFPVTIVRRDANGGSRFYDPSYVL